MNNLNHPIRELYNSLFISRHLKKEELEENEQDSLLLRGILLNKKLPFGGIHLTFDKILRTLVYLQDVESSLDIVKRELVIFFQAQEKYNDYAGRCFSSIKDQENLLFSIRTALKKTTDSLEDFEKIFENVIKAKDYFVKNFSENELLELSKDIDKPFGGNI
jgi:hypothetical protein